MEEIMNDKWISIDEAAEYLGIKTVTLRSWIRNKTPISASSNREIGGVAPSTYLGKLEKKGSVLESDLDGYVETHWIDHTLLRNDEFQDFIIDRAKKLLSAIEVATGRTISGKDSDEVQQAFGASLI